MRQVPAAPAFHPGAVLGWLYYAQREVVADWGECREGLTAECDWRMEILDLWGNDASELFLATLETHWIEGTRERRPHVLRYDGERFHDM
ncbi:MAG: hypothetical protein ABI333_19470 [bacterium]